MKRNWPIGGFANGILKNDLIGLPLNDRKYRPINLLPFDKVTRKSSDTKLETHPNIHKIENEIKIVRANITN